MGMEEASLLAFLSRSVYGMRSKVEEPGDRCGEEGQREKGRGIGGIG